MNRTGRILRKKIFEITIIVDIFEAELLDIQANSKHECEIIQSVQDVRLIFKPNFRTLFEKKPKMAEILTLHHL